MTKDLTKLKLLLLFISFLCLTVAHAQTERNKQPLIKILEKLQSRHDCNFSYIDKNIKNIFLEPPDDSLTLNAAINYLQERTPLLFTIISDNYIAITKDGKKYFSICGYLTDGVTGMPVEGAVVQTKNSSTISDKNGYFELEDLMANDLVTFRHISYKTLVEYAQVYQTQDCEVIFLDSKIELLSEIILKDYVTNGIDKVIDGSITINYKNFGIVPGLIETDVLQTVQALSGLVSVDETVSNINIRGGTHDQNLIRWDGIKLYQSGHFFGLISAVNPRITKNVTLVKNGTTASLTDGVSGTIDMRTEYNTNQDLKAEVGLNFVNADVFVDAPVTEKSSVQIAVRKSINEYLNTPTYSRYFDRAFQNSDVLASSEYTDTTEETFDFLDTSLRAIYKISDKDRFSANFLFLDNKLSIAENAFGSGSFTTRPSTLDQQNIAGGLQYERKWNQSLKTELQAYMTAYQLDAVNYNILEEQKLDQGNTIDEVGISVNTNYKINDQLSFLGGYYFKNTAVANSDKLNYPRLDTVQERKLTSHALAAEAKLSTNDYRTHIRTGLRANYYQEFNRFLIEPRLAVNHKINDNFSVELLGEFKNQTTTLLNENNPDYDNFLGIENRRWFLSDNNEIPVLRSKQVSVGGSYKYRSFLVNGSLYYKNVNGITTLSQGFQNQYEYTSDDGRYEVAGADLIFNNKFERLNTWLGYSFAKNNYTFNNLPINRFASNYDIRHTVSLAAAYDYKKLKFSTGLLYRTGKPTTNLSTENPVINGALNFQSPNSGRLPDYYRFDASVIYDFTLSKRFKINVAASLLNILDRKNLIDRYYRIDPDDNSKFKEYNAYSLGITPNFALRLFF